MERKSLKESFLSISFPDFPFILSSENKTSQKTQMSLCWSSAVCLWVSVCCMSVCMHMCAPYIYICIQEYWIIFSDKWWSNGRWLLHWPPATNNERRCSVHGMRSIKKNHKSSCWYFFPSCWYFFPVFTLISTHSAFLHSIILSKWTSKVVWNYKIQWVFCLWKMFELCNKESVFMSNIY